MMMMEVHETEPCHYTQGPFKLRLVVRPQHNVFDDNTSIIHQDVRSLVLIPTANIIGQLCIGLTNTHNVKVHDDRVLFHAPPTLLVLDETVVFHIAPSLFNPGNPMGFPITMDPHDIPIILITDR